MFATSTALHDHGHGCMNNVGLRRPILFNPVVRGAIHVRLAGAEANER